MIGFFLNISLRVHGRRGHLEIPLLLTFFYHLVHGRRGHLETAEMQSLQPCTVHGRRGHLET